MVNYCKEKQSALLRYEYLSYTIKTGTVFISMKKQFYVYINKNNNNRYAMPANIRKNKMQAINTYAMPMITYTAEIIDWNKRYTI